MMPRLGGKHILSASSTTQSKRLPSPSFHIKTAKATDCAKQSPIMSILKTLLSAWPVDMKDKIVWEKRPHPAITTRISVEIGSSFSTAPKSAGLVNSDAKLSILRQKPPTTSASNHDIPLHS